MEREDPIAVAGLPTEPHQDTRYRAYMIRFWHVDDAADAGWRISVEDVHSDERKVFANLPAFFAFLEEDIAVVDEELS